MFVRQGPKGPRDALVGGDGDVAEEQLRGSGQAAAPAYECTCMAASGIRSTLGHPVLCSRTYIFTDIPFRTKMSRTTSTAVLATCRSRRIAPPQQR